MPSCFVPQCQNPDGRHRFPTKDRELRILDSGCEKGSEQRSIENLNGCFGHQRMYGIQLILLVHFRSSELPINKLKKAISV